MTIALGIDVAGARNGLDLVALDGHSRVTFSLKRASLNDVQDVVARLRPDAICIDSPDVGARGRRPNRRT